MVLSPIVPMPRETVLHETPQCAALESKEQAVEGLQPVPAPPRRQAQNTFHSPNDVLPQNSTPRPTVAPASHYDEADDLCVITCYFNSQGFASKRHNYDLFRTSITHSGIHLITIECAFGSTPFELDHTPSTIRLRTKHVMWQKERLLNLAISKVPRRYTKIAWLDCDILFENASWARETSRLLNTYPVIQPFHYAFRLRPDEQAYFGKGERYRSFAAVHATFPSISRVGSFFHHGHTGFAWAAKREIVEDIGLYDAAVAGGSDHLMAHAFCGDFGSRCLYEMFLNASGFLDHYKLWATAAWRKVQGKIFFVPGAILHLWHGEMHNRQYPNRMVEFAHLDFNPSLDLLVDNNGLWQWSEHNPALASWATAYFARRLEDESWRHITEED